MAIGWLIPIHNGHSSGSPLLLRELIVHLERLNRGTANHCQANNIYPIVTPTEMLMPLLRARMKQRHLGAGFRIETARLDPLIAVTLGTHQT